MENKTIYIISTFEKMDTIPDEFNPGKRVPDYGFKVINGWYSKREVAESTVKDNKTDIWETCYNFAVIEECGEGFYDFDRNMTYYKYNTDTNKYDEMNNDEIPPEFYGVAFSISGVGM